MSVSAQNVPRLAAAQARNHMRPVSQTCSLK